MWRRLFSKPKQEPGAPTQPRQSGLPGHAVSAPGPAPPEANEQTSAEGRREPPWVADYRRKIVESYGTVRILDMTEALPLDKLYIPLALSPLSDDAPRAEALERRFVDVEDQLRLDDDWRRHAGTSFAGPEEALRELRHVAVVGDPGAGKTTMLRNLALRLARGEVASLPALPIVIELHSLGHSPLLGSVAPDRLFVAWLARQTELAVPSAQSVEGWLVEKLRAGQAVLLLDGLDELAGAAPGETEPYRVVSRAVASFAEAYPEVPTLITCRHAHIRRVISIPKGFQILQTSPFEWEHVRRFVGVWFQNSPETGESLALHFKRNARLRGLAANPLLLALICLIFQRRGSLPQRRSDIYKRCVDVLLAEWDATRRKDRFARFTLEHKEDLLRRVGWSFHVRGQRYSRREELVRLVASFLPMIRLHEEDAEPILDEIGTHHGLLKDFGQGWYGFHHFTIQEHFAMEHITSWQRLDAAIALRDRSWWREIIRLYAGKGDCTELVCRLATEREDLFQSNLFLVGECLNEGSAVAPGLLVHVQDELTRIARHQSKPMESRVRATDLAMRLLPDDAPSATVNWLTDDRVPVAGRLAAVRRLSHGLSPALTRALKELITSSALDIGIRESLVAVLSADADDEELRSLLNVVSREPDPSTLQRLGLVVGQARSEHGEALIRILAESEVPLPLRLGIAVALGHCAQPEARELVNAACDSVADAAVRSALEVALVMLGDARRLQSVRATLLDRTGDLLVRIQAADALRVRDRTVAHDVLGRIANDRTQERALRIVAVRHLASIADEAMLTSLMGLVRDEAVDRFVRAAILEAIGESHLQNLTKPLLSLLNDSGVLEYVRRAAVDAFGALADTETIPHLIDLSRGGKAEPRVRARALLALGRIGSELALKEAARELTNRSTDRGLRRALAEVMHPSGTALDGEVLGLACRWIGETDIPGAMLTVIARFAAESGKIIYPEDAGAPPIEYPWARQEASS